MKNLYEKLSDYGQADVYPFHMPGHKRHLGMDCDPYLLDITEIEGFDSLHHAEGILRDTALAANELYRAKETFLLVNGSTGGILAALGACGRGGVMVAARNCHKSVYNGLAMHHMHARYLVPETLTSWGIAGAVTAGQVEAALAENRESGRRTDGVVITSPTYEGVVSDVKAIGEVCHRYGVPLIVDAAHGAHLGLAGGEMFPPSAVACGGDIVVHSIHKTLPAMTQTALLHIRGDLVPEKKLRRLLAAYQTSSPSYVLMAGISRCVTLLKEQGNELFEQYEKRLAALRRELGQCRQIRLFALPEGTCDPGKIVLFVPGEKLTGKQFMDLLRREYGLELEMAGPDYVIAMTSVMDTEEGFARLEKAVTEIDRRLASMPARQEADDMPSEGRPPRAQDIPPERLWADDILPELPRTQDIPEAVLEPWQALDMLERRAGRTDAPEAGNRKAHEEPIRTPLEQAAGRVSCEYAYVYPPGIPLVVPGEVFTEELCAALGRARRQGLSVEGMEDAAGEFVWTVERSSIYG